MAVENWNLNPVQGNAWVVEVEVVLVACPEIAEEADE
jgi:hypothetical protein